MASHAMESVFFEIVGEPDGVVFVVHYTPNPTSISDDYSMLRFQNENFLNIAQNGHFHKFKFKNLGILRC
jgi:hypothetical protein